MHKAQQFVSAEFLMCGHLKVHKLRNIWFEQYTLDTNDMLKTLKLSLSFREAKQVNTWQVITYKTLLFIMLMWLTFTFCKQQKICFLGCFSIFTLCFPGFSVWTSTGQSLFRARYFNVTHLIRTQGDTQRTVASAFYWFLQEVIKCCFISYHPHV